MKRDNFGGILAFFVIIGVVYYLYKQGGTTGTAVNNLFTYLKNLTGTTAGGSRTLTGLVPASLGTVPTYLNPVAGDPGLSVIASTPTQSSQQNLAAILNAPVGIVASPGANGGDVNAQVAAARIAFVM